MRHLIFASILVMAITAIGQIEPNTRSRTQGGQALRLDDQATGYPQTNSVCYAIETFRFKNIRPLDSVRHSTCTDAHLFRVRNIPNLTVIPHLSLARCSGCSMVPMRQQPEHLARLRCGI